MKRVKVTSDGTTVGTLVEVDGQFLPVLRAEVILRAAELPQVVLVLDTTAVDLEIVTRQTCGAAHPTHVGVRCEGSPHGRGTGHAGEGYVWTDEP